MLDARDPATTVPPDAWPPRPPRRLASPDAVHHPIRAALLELIERLPGLHYRELGRRQGLPNGQLQHHLDALVRGGWIRRLALGGYSCCFLARHVPNGQPPPDAAIKCAGARRVYDALRERPGQSVAALARMTGLSPRTVGYHVHRLRRLALVVLERRGAALAVVPAPGASPAGAPM